MCSVFGVYGWAMRENITKYQNNIIRITKEVEKLSPACFGALLLPCLCCCCLSLCCCYCYFMGLMPKTRVDTYKAKANDSGGGEGSEVEERRPRR